MDPFQLMVAEHRVIEGVLDTLADYGTAVAADAAAADPERLAGFVEFLRGYADAIHHGKEEQIVFAALRGHGVPGDLAPVLAAIHRDHEQGRLLIGELAACGRRPVPWSEADRARVARAARDYVSLLRRHIRDEDGDVFPRTAAAMPDKLRRQVAAACERFEADHAARRAALTELAARLTGRS